jgi:hypothetical protein
MIFERFLNDILQVIIERVMKKNLHFNQATIPITIKLTNWQNFYAFTWQVISILFNYSLSKQAVLYLLISWCVVILTHGVKGLRIFFPHTADILSFCAHHCIILTQSLENGKRLLLKCENLSIKWIYFREFAYITEVFNVSSVCATHFATVFVWAAITAKKWIS